MKNITIPSSVISIGYRAFYNCTGLINVIFLNTSGWYTGDNTEISVTVTNATVNAQNLVTNYSSCFWKVMNKT